jgi:hypothetical protein
MSRHMRRRQRGQAVVETALGILVFVSILVWGIHFAEISYLAPKVHEAAASALWDTTAEQMHVHPNNYSKRSKAIKNAGNLAEKQYANFDGRTKGKKKNNLSLVFTGAGDLEVRCNQVGLGDTTQNNFTAFTGEGGMACYAMANFKAINFPKRFLDQGKGKLFKERNYPLALNWMRFCSFGRANGGSCSQSRIGMLLDDWGLASGPNESADCTLDACTNQPFHDLVQNVYGQAYAGGGAGKAMATSIVGAAPGGSESKFWFSYLKGPDPGMTGGDSDPADWATNVVENTHFSIFQNRPQEGRFLGIKDAIK